MDALQEKYKNLIIRISGVTDDVLKEQLQEECVMLEERIQIEASKIQATVDAIKQVEIQKFEEFLLTFVSDHKEFYRTQFIKEEDLVLALEITNNKRNLSNMFKQNRLRAPTKLSQRKELLYIANTLNWFITVCDMESLPVDTIGVKKDDSINIKIYVDAFSRWDEYDHTTHQIVIPRHCSPPFL
jgi:hypothetical protein